MKQAHRNLSVGTTFIHQHFPRCTPTIESYLSLFGDNHFVLTLFVVVRASMVTIFPLVIVLIPFVLGCYHNYCYEDDDQDSPNTLSTSVWFADVRASDGDGRLLQRGACGVCASRVDVALLQRSPACASRIGACSRRVLLASSSVSSHFGTRIRWRSGSSPLPVDCCLDARSLVSGWSRRHKHRECCWACFAVMAIGSLVVLRLSFTSLLSLCCIDHAYGYVPS